MSRSWCKVASNLDSHPKIRKAGRLAREVFLFALRRNAEPGNPVPGRLPKYQLDSWYIAEQLQMPESEAVTGVTDAVTHGLLREEGNSYLIVGFDEAWGRMPIPGKDRQAKYREKEKLEKGVTKRDARGVTKSNGDESDVREEKRRDKTPGQVDADLTVRLMGWIVKNNPKHKITTLTRKQHADHVASWADHVRKMRELDRRDPLEIGRVIDWCQSHTFWHGNILSTEKLRSQYDQLVTKMRGEPGNTRQIQQPAPADDTPPLFMFREGK